MRLRARWVFPGDGPPLRDAVVSVAHGRIVEVGENQHGTAQNLGNVALIPGLINAHTHLEFSLLDRPIEPRRHFADWIRAVIVDRRERPSDLQSSIVAGLKSSLAAGVTGLAEIATSDWILNDAATVTPRPRCLVFREILGLRESGIVEQLESAELFLKQCQDRQLPDVGLSPHAPYSLHPKLFRGLCDLATTRDVPLAMHLAESPAEMMLLREGSGPLVDLFSEMGLWRPGVIPVGTRPLRYLQELARAPRALVVHGTFLDREEIDFVAAHPRMSVIYCPRTHAAMQTGPHPWRAMLHQGVNVALGSDSRASNPDLSIWGELQFLKTQAADLAASQLLSLATVRAANALGWEECGGVAPNKVANLCVVELSDAAVDKPEEFLFEGRLSKVLLQGRWISDQ